MKKLEIQIPFEGFYNSLINSLIDDAILSMFDIDGSRDQDSIPESWYNHFNYNQKMLDEICIEYVKNFKEWLDSECNIKLDSLEFKALESPKYYNYETDRICCTISESEARALRRIAKDSDFQQVIKDRHESRSGFMSFYKTDWNLWKDLKPVKMDHNELHTLLIAAILSAGGELYHGIPDSYALWEASRCNGFFSDVIYNNLNEECRALLPE